MPSDTILVCPSCNSKFNGRNVTHTHTGGDFIDSRFLTCNTCHGQGAVTCETCGGAGRIVMRDGKIVGTHARPATLNVLGPRKPK
jgi:DnaJ-class molecular chaperone